MGRRNKNAGHLIRKAIREALKGAKPVSATVTDEGGRGAYDLVRHASIMVEWDNGRKTLHHDRYCGEGGLEGGMYRRFVKVVGLEVYDPEWHEYLEAECRLTAFGPREARRFEAAEKLA